MQHTVRAGDNEFLVYNSEGKQKHTEHAERAGVPEKPFVAKDIVK